MAPEGAQSEWDLGPTLGRVPWSSVFVAAVLALAGGPPKVLLENNLELSAPKSMCFLKPYFSSLTH